MPGRFQVFGWRPGADHGVWWRLISDNGRQLAVSPVSFSSFEAAAEAAFTTRLSAPEGAVVIASEARSGWSWALRPVPDLGAGPLALSGRRYARRVELVESIARFRVIAAAAEVSTSIVVFRRGGAVRESVSSDARVAGPRP